jgi:hypothetical protein
MSNSVGKRRMGDGLAADPVEAEDIDDQAG